jgi:ABC-type nitrate/sulfonate/bicarbonate transport system substrate-binding protein
MGVNIGWKSLAAPLALVLLAGAALAIWRLAAPGPAPPPAPVFQVRFAMPVQVAAGALYVADQERLFARQGLAVAAQRFLLGKQALQAVLDDQADFAIVADTPFLLAVLRGEPIAALGTVFESRKTIALLAHRDSGVRDTPTLEGKRIGTVFGTNAEFFLDTMLEVHGVSRAKVQVVNLTPEELVVAFRNKQIDAMTAWNPDLARLEQEFGSRAITIYGEDLFVYRFLLVAKQGYIAKHGAQVRRMLTAIRQGNDFIKEHPEQARSLLGAQIGIAPALLKHSFDPTDYTLVLDQSLLLALSAQTRWATAKALVKPGPTPDYLDFVRPEPLSAVAPDANRMIH